MQWELLDNFNPLNYKGGDYFMLLDKHKYPVILGLVCDFNKLEKIASLYLGIEGEPEDLTKYTHFLKIEFPEGE